MNLPWVESPFFSKILETKKLSAEQKNIAQAYHDNGFVHLPNFVSPDLINKINQEKQAITLASYQPVLDLLDVLYGKEAFPFQTQNFNSLSQQNAHADSIHFGTLPARFSCAVFVALEDVTADNGSLFFYSGSHKLPEYNLTDIKESAEPSTNADLPAYENFINDLVNLKGYKKEILLAKKGDAFLVSNNLIYGTMPLQKAGSSSKLQLTHYFFKDCYYYTPLLSNMLTHELSLKTHVRNMKTNEIVIPNYNGQSLKLVKTGENKYMFEPELSLMNVLKFYGKKYTKKLIGK